MARWLVAILLLIGLARPAFAQAPAPVGNWVPEDDPRAAAVMVMPNGDYLSRDPQTTLEGRWSWNPTGPTGGIFTITYRQPTATRTFVNSLYFSVEWLDRGRVLVTDPASQQRRVWLRQ